MSKVLAINGGSKAVTEKASSWPRVGEEEIKAVQQALRKSSEDSRYLTAAQGGGPMEEFEKAFADYVGTKYAVSTNGGTAALHIALMAAGVEVGDEVICPSYTWVQSAGCILHQNGIPIYADIDAKTYNLDPNTIEDKITEKTRAIIAVHLYGQAADMDPIMEIAQKHNLVVIEDVAQAAGATYKGRKVGSIGHIGCFSIGDGKNMIGGEGGVVVTDDENLFDKVILVGMHSMRQERDLKSEEMKKWIDCLGYNYRIHPLAAVIANVQLKYLDRWNEERRENAHYLSQKLEGLPAIRPPFEDPNCKHVFHQYSPTYVPEELDNIPRDCFVHALKAEGVPVTAYVDLPIHLRRMHQERQFFYGKHFPWSSKFAREGIEYKRGDCPVSERRCEREELNMGSSGWIGEKTKLLGQYAEGFRKIVEHADEIPRDYVRPGKEDPLSWRPLWAIDAAGR